MYAQEIGSRGRSDSREVYESSIFILPRFGFGRGVASALFGLHLSGGNSPCSIYIYVAAWHDNAIIILLYPKDPSIMSKGTVHQIAAGGFGTGTNDLVREFLLPAL